MRETKNFKRGRDGERIVAEWLKERGYYIIPSYDYSGENGDKAPKMHGATQSFAIPDLDVCRNGERRWVEVKTKFVPTFHRHTGEFEHGIAWHLYSGYMSVQDFTGCEIWIAIYEENSSVLLGRRLGKLTNPRIYRGHLMDWSGSVFWRRDQFHMMSFFGLSSDWPHHDNRICLDCKWCIIDSTRGDHECMLQANKGTPYPVYLCSYQRQNDDKLKHIDCGFDGKLFEPKDCANAA